MKVKLLKPHTHNGTPYASDQSIDVNAAEKTTKKEGK